MWMQEAILSNNGTRTDITTGANKCVITNDDICIQDSVGGYGDIFSNGA